MTDAVAEGYDAVYSGWFSSPEFHSIWATHAVDGSVADGYEHLNFAPVEQLRRMAADLRLQPGDRLLDVACGAGGPGLWIAHETGAQLVGLDLSRVGTRRAEQRAHAPPVDGASFIVGSADSTGLATGSFMGAMSIDSLQYVPDKRAAFAEITRVLAPGGRFAFTAFEIDRERVVGVPVLGADAVGDYRPILQAVGLDVETYEQTRGWETRLRSAYSAVVAAETRLRPQMGDAAMDSLLLEMSLTLAVEPYRGRVYVAARRRSSS